MTHICVSKQTSIGSDRWLVAWPEPSHYLNQCWNIVDWTLRNKLQWNLNRNSYTFIQENAFEDVVWKMAAILPWPQCVKRKVWGVFLFVQCITNILPLLFFSTLVVDVLHACYCELQYTIFSRAWRAMIWVRISSVTSYKMCNRWIYGCITVSQTWYHGKAKD